MALNLLSQFPTCSLARLPPLSPMIPAARGHGNMARKIRRSASAQISEPPTLRRSGNYQPTIWSYDFIQSLKSHYKGEVYAERIEELKEAARRCLEEADGPLAQLELIDDLQRLGVGRLFEKEIDGKLKAIYMGEKEMVTEGDIHSTALYFRLLREHVFEVSPEILRRFKDETGSFRAGLCDDPIGLLSLYEASYHGLDGETILDEAKAFTSKHLRELKHIQGNIAMQVDHALELPVHWRMTRLEARWYVDFYEKKEGMNPILLQLAKLDFNMVQSNYQRELRKVSRWWDNLGLAKKLSFARDRLVEDYLWSMGIVFEPRFGHCREVLTGLLQFITTVDDMYDVYGSLDELELFTDAVDRWDINTIERLPEYMRICFLALYNSTHDAAYVILREHGLDIIPYLSKAWANYCKAGLVEAKWYNSSYTPTLKEYLNNAWISISGPIVLIHTFFLLGQKPSKESIDCLTNDQNLIRSSSLIFRLNDDLGTSTDELARGDVPKSIQCYMHEVGVSEEIAREHIKGVISDLWKKMNQHRATLSALPKSFIAAAFDLPRMSTCAYLYGDGFGVPDRETKDIVMSLVVEPIRL
ncbi:monoterepene synthase TPS1, chloropastic-like isoform X2 [Magnolia sinica]|uniref:monoterepene synthase TPS1, chloropastic-like isoform X2 n=1 Tax=Magnolia sinica TaxID=86752 RepID=UPI0026597429|nr:monoterepene synthase TPS1, chloropastic-like isoform X2 [Magnolia sinica]